MGLLRWWRYRKLKRCREEGHDPKVECRRGYQRPWKREGARSWTRPVAFRVKQKRTVCRRCRREIEGWEELEARPLTGISLPKRMHDRLSNRGELWL